MQNLLRTPLASAADGEGEVRDSWADAGAQEGAEVLDAVQRGCAASAPCYSGGHSGPHLAGSRSRPGIAGRMLH